MQIARRASKCTGKAPYRGCRDTPVGRAVTRTVTLAPANRVALPARRRGVKVRVTVTVKAFTDAAGVAWRADRAQRTYHYAVAAAPGSTVGP